MRPSILCMIPLIRDAKGDRDVTLYPPKPHAEMRQGHGLVVVWHT